jgi:hypothetical protein
MMQVNVLAVSPSNMQDLQVVGGNGQVIEWLLCNSDA